MTQFLVRVYDRWWRIFLKWPFLTLVVSVGIVYGLFFGGYLAVRYGYNYYARHTFMRSFYDKVAIAEAQSKKIRLDNYVASEEHGEPSRGRRNKLSFLENCSVAGTYREYDPPRTIRGARFCSYTFVSYYGITDLSQVTVDKARRQIFDAGWQSADKVANVQSITADMIAGAKTGSGFHFTESSGINASLVFLNKARPVPFSQGSNCSGYSYCRFLRKTDAHFRYYFVLSVYYSQDPS